MLHVGTPVKYLNELPYRHRAYVAMQVYRPSHCMFSILLEHRMVTGPFMDSVYYCLLLQIYRHQYLIIIALSLNEWQMFGKLHERRRFKRDIHIILPHLPILNVFSTRDF